MLHSTLHLTPETHSSLYIMHVCSKWMKGMLLWASSSCSLQSFFELRREEKSKWCSFYMRCFTIWHWLLFQWVQRQSHLTGITLLMLTSPSEEPPLHSTCRISAPVSQQQYTLWMHMCAPVWVCDINTSEGDFHHVFSGTLWGMALKRKSEPHWDVLLNPLSGWAWGGVNPAVKHYLTLTKTAVAVAAVADRR